MIQRPRYLIGSMFMWGAFFFKKLFDDYDGIMSWIGAPIVATFLLVISLPIVLILGLVRRNHAFGSSWYSSTTTARAALVVSLVILTFGHTVGIREAYTYTNSLGDIVTASRLHSFVSLPAFFVAAFSVIYWPEKKKGDKTAHPTAGNVLL